MASIRSIGDQLRQARQSKGVTLDDVSASTRIFKKYLEEIENGALPPMPMTYVRAFIRAYAEQVGLPGDELLQELVRRRSRRAADVRGRCPPPPPAASRPSIHTSAPPRNPVLLVVSSITILASCPLVWTNRDGRGSRAGGRVFDVMKRQEGAWQAQTRRDTTWRRPRRDPDNLSGGMAARASGCT
jgi:transcriptional regulator with XRE-family HTH domain